MQNEIEKLHITADGSVTLQDEETGELFHNRAGAYSEALVNFVRPLSLEKNAFALKEYAVLDVCFGLGYNTFALLMELALLPSAIERVKVLAIEKNELPLHHLSDVLRDERLKLLRDAIEEGAPAFAAGALGVHQFVIGGIDPTGTKARKITVEINLIGEDLRVVVPRLAAEVRFKRSLDAIFHDAFSPLRAPYLWTIDLFDCYRKLLRMPGGRFVTYSAASAIRGALEQCEFTVRRTAGLGAKRGGTLAILGESLGAANLENESLDLLEEELHKMHGRPGVPYRDPTFQESCKNIQIAREAEQDLLFPVPKINNSRRRPKRK